MCPVFSRDWIDGCNELNLKFEQSLSVLDKRTNYICTLDGGFYFYIFYSGEEKAYVCDLNDNDRDIRIFIFPEVETMDMGIVNRVFVQEVRKSNNMARIFAFIFSFRGHDSPYLTYPSEVGFNLSWRNRSKHVSLCKEKP